MSINIQRILSFETAVPTDQTVHGFRLTACYGAKGGFVPKNRGKGAALLRREDAGERRDTVSALLVTQFASVVLQIL